MNNSQVKKTLNSSDEEVKSILSTILNINIWNKNTENFIISAINKLLSVSKTRLQGLEYLNLIINNCSLTVISENGITWILHCLVKYPGDDLKEIKLNTIGKIVDNSYKESEFNKRFISDYISKIFEICLSTHTNFSEIGAALKTLAICMKHYGSWFAPHKLRIEKFILNFFDNPSENVVENAAIAFHYSQQIGGAGSDGVNHKTNFSKNFEKLCATVHKLFDRFLQNEMELDDTDRSGQETFEFADLSLHTQKMLHITARRIKNCLKFITTMLLKGFPVEKEIIPSNVLDIVIRGTSAHRCLGADNESSLEDFQFSILLTQTQIELLKILHVLVIWLHGNALPFAFSITKILTDCLNKSQLCQCFQTDSLYQETVYKVLSCWIRISKGGLHPHFQAHLIKCILKDVTTIESSITLNLQNGLLKNQSNKSKQKAIQERIISSGQEHASTKELTNAEKFNREKNCLLALETLKQIIVATILKLNNDILKELNSTVINTLIHIQTSKASHPYTNLKCQAKLYEVLVAFYEQESLRTLPPVQLTIDILTRGINNSDRMIALTCEQGLSILEKMCQPLCPSLFTSDVVKEDMKKSVPVIDDEVVNDILEDTENDTNELREMSSNNEVVENSIRIEQMSNDKGMDEENHDVETCVYEENIEIMVNTEITEDGAGSATLKEESTVHIIDMQIIKTSATNVRFEEQKNSESLTVNEQQTSTVEIEQVQETESLKRIKSEILSQSSMEEIIESVETAEPPLKKMRVEQDLSDLNVKEEEKEEQEDDIFEEGEFDFVDVVNDY